MNTTPPVPARTSSSASRIWRSSRSRPTSRDSARSSRVRAPARTPATAAAITVSCFPLSDSSTGSDQSNCASTSRCVVCPTSTWPGSAADWSRAAVLTVSPNAAYSTRCPAPMGPRTTGPVFDADADAEPLDAPRGRDLARVGGDVLRDPDRRAHGALGVVLVGDGGAEQRQDAVAGQVLHRSPERLDGVDDPGDRLADDQLDLLGVQPLAERRGADEVGEDGGHDLAFLPHDPAILTAFPHRTESP